MSDDQALLLKVRRQLAARRFRIRIHDARHMTEEGFGEQDILEALLGNNKVLECYPEESRCLIVGYFHLSKKVSSPLHVVCDYSNSNVLDIVTAYIPERPWWSTPTRRGLRR